MKKLKKEETQLPVQTVLCARKGSGEQNYIYTQRSCCLPNTAVLEFYFMHMVSESDYFEHHKDDKFKKRNVTKKAPLPKKKRKEEEAATVFFFPKTRLMFPIVFGHDMKIVR